MKSFSIKTRAICNTESSALLVQKASQYKSLITLTSGSKKANAKSIMGLLTLGLMDGQEICVEAEGEDEGEAAAAMGVFLAN
jgi:catabolite repression HPr-like protein